MRSYFLSTIVLLISVSFLAGCAHTNELAKYNLNKQPVLLRGHVTPSASTIQVTTGSVSTSNKKNDLLSAITDIGSNLVSNNVKNKLQKSINTDSLNVYVQNGLKNSLITYLNIKPVKTIDNNPSFIVETVLKQCKLISDDYGVFVRVKADSRIIDRNSGKIIWDNTEVETSALDRKYFNGTNTDSNVSKVVNLVRLSSLSTEAINKAVDQAAISVGSKMGNTLREDVAEANSK